MKNSGRNPLLWCRNFSSILKQTFLLNLLCSVVLDFNQIAFGAGNGIFFSYSNIVSHYSFYQAWLTFPGGSSPQISMSALPRCIIVMPIPCALTCRDPIAVTASWDTFGWMISPAQVSSWIRGSSSVTLRVLSVWLRFWTTQSLYKVLKPSY